MRLAIVAASSYTQNQKLTELALVESEVELLCQRLIEPDASYSVHFLRAERGLAEQIEQLLAAAQEPIEALLFYFAGYSVVSDERGPALLLDGDRLSAFSLRRARRLISQSSPSSLVILDTISAFDGQSVPASVVRSLNDVLMGGHGGIHVLAANRPEQDGTHGWWPFTSLLATVLDWHAGGPGLSPAALLAAMRAQEALFAQIPFVELFEAPTDFQVLKPYAGPAPSLPPMAVPLSPSEDAEARADACVRAGDFSAALGEYGVVVERLGPYLTNKHAAIYVKIASTLAASGRDSDALAYFEAALDIDGELTAALQGAAELRIAAGDTEEALSLLHRWLTVDPNALHAAELAAQLLTQVERWTALAGLYEFVLGRVSEPSTAAELALELSALCRDHLGDPERALPALEHAADLAPDENRLRLLLVELNETRGEFSRALAHLRAALRGDPGYTPGYRSALRLFERCAEVDGAWNAACALEVLGEADINDSLLADAHRHDGLLQAHGSLSEEHYKERLLCPERDCSVDSLLAALGDVVVDLGLETAQRKRRLMALEASTEYDPQTSTATVAKTLLWATRLLGLPVPKLHVIASLPTALGTAPVREPTLLMNKSLGSGLELREIAFLWSRQLLFLRPEHRAILWFPSVPELASLMLAALSVGGLTQIPFKRLEGDAKLFGRSLKRRLSPDALETLKAVIESFPLRDAKDKMLAWARAVEFAAGRAGLLACGDVEIAARITRRFPMGGLTETEDQVKDLLAYALSPEYESLRRSLGVRIES